MRECLKLFLAASVLLAGSATSVFAQEESEEEKLGWLHQAELSWVSTSGNSDTSTIGFKDLSVRRWKRSSFEIRVEGVRAESTTEIRIGTDIDNRPGEISETTAERYLLEGRYNRKISDKFFWMTGAGWDRNRPSGIEDRYNVFAGVGNIWRNDEKVKFRTGYAFNYTDEQQTTGFDDSFGGLRLSWGYLRKFGEDITFIDELVIDENLEETSDLRVDFFNSVAVALSGRLALKVGLRLLFDNEPAFGEFPLFDAPPGQGGARTGTVVDQLDELDTIFTTSLVVTF
jgi:putative salt-induced outer membrane protein YdiY